jgi:hypothetical protein
MTGNFKLDFLNNQSSPEGKKNSAEKPCSSSFQWCCLFVSPGTSSGCHNSIKVALFAWPLIGHRQNFGPQIILGNIFMFFHVEWCAADLCNYHIDCKRARTSFLLFLGIRTIPHCAKIRASGPVRVHKAWHINQARGYGAHQGGQEAP